MSWLQSEMGNRNWNRNYFEKLRYLNWNKIRIRCSEGIEIRSKNWNGHTYWSWNQENNINSNPSTLCTWLAMFSCLFIYLLSRLKAFNTLYDCCNSSSRPQ